MSEHRALKVGLIGAGIQHSSSPSMHVDEGKALGLSISYELLDFDLMQGGVASGSRRCSTKPSNAVSPDSTSPIRRSRR